MPSYANILLFCVGLATALPAPHHDHGRHGRRPWMPSRPSSSTAMAASPTLAPSSSAESSFYAAATSVVDYPESTPVAAAASSAAATTTVAEAAAAATGSIWQPTAGTSWQILLNTKLDATKDLTPDVDVFDIDMETNDAGTMSTLRQKGKKVICYFSAGSYEPYRADAYLFQPADLGSVMDGWPDEKWIDIRSQNVRNIMAARIQLAKQKGCHGIDPDNVDGYNNGNGLGLTQADALDYMKFLAKVAADNGLAIGLKNAGALVPSVVDFIQYSVNEQCHQYSECNNFQPFINKNKPVFNIEYPSETGSTAAVVRTIVCPTDIGANSKGFSTVIKNLDLGGYVLLCDDSSATTSTY